MLLTLHFIARVLDVIVDYQSGICPLSSATKLLLKLNTRVNKRRHFGLIGVDTIR